MSNPRDTYDALLVEIKRQSGLVAQSQLNAVAQAAAVRDLALAFRYVSGGPQPGTTVVEK